MLITTSEADLIVVYCLFYKYVQHPEHDKKDLCRGAQPDKSESSDVFNFCPTGLSAARRM